jgi:hypothetical protein
MPDIRFDDYAAIILHPTDDRILLLKRDDGWTLPTTTVPLSPDDGRWRDTFRVNRAFSQRFGSTVTVLECLFVSPFPAVGQHGNSVFVLSNHDLAWTLPPEGAWISHEMLDMLLFTIPEHRLLLKRWLTKASNTLDEGLPVLLKGAWNPLTEEEQEHLYQVAPYLKSSCFELARLGIPASIHHGDFHRGNILVNETGCTLIDWAAFVGVAHPFLSLWVPLSDWDISAQTILSESYLEVWSSFAPKEQLRHALVLAHPLAALCGALGHRYQIKHAHTALSWDILNEQENLLDCLRSIFALIDRE